MDLPRFNLQSLLWSERGPDALSMTAQRDRRSEH